MLAFKSVFEDLDLRFVRLFEEFKNLAVRKLFVESSIVY